MDLEEKFKEDVEEFCKAFPTPLHYRERESDNGYWVFWSQDDDDHDEILQQQQQQQQGFQMHNYNDPFSADIMWRRMISDKIKRALLSATWDNYYGYVVQFWAPVMTISGRRLLSTSGQPFAFSLLSKLKYKYRLLCMEYQYSINDDDDDDDDDDDAAMIISDAPTATAFLNHLPQFVSFENTSSYTVDPAFKFFSGGGSYMLPICFPTQTPSSCCVGVLDLSIAKTQHIGETVNSMIRALKGVGLGVFQIQERIPYQIIHGLEPARDEIEQALKNLCKSSNTPILAQVWIAFEDDNNMSFSEATRKKHMLSVKLTGYNPGPEDPERNDSVWYDQYYRLCDLLPLEMGEDFVEKTLQDHKPRFCDDVKKLSGHTLVKKFFFRQCSSSLAICLNSIHTRDFCYAFEFMWPQDDPNANVKFVEQLLLNIKECLPGLKHASGAKLGDELDLIMVGDSTATEIQFLKIFQGKRLSLIPDVLEEGSRIRDSIVVDYNGIEQQLFKTTPIPLSREVTEQQFGNTAEILKGDDLHVENSTSSEKIFQECLLLPQPEALARGKKAVVKNRITALEKKYKTAPIILSQEDIENQYQKTMKEAAKALDVSLSTLKRKCKQFGISEWRGPSLIKRKVNYSINQSDKNEEFGGAVQDPLAIKQNENTLTIKAKYKEDTFKFHICISEATFILVEEEIGKTCKLTHGTYKLNYLDEDEEWIVLASDQDMTNCIKSSRNLGRNVVRLRVLPST